ncbi:hypothetical protein BV511_12800 [Methylorubrum extorquens]|uniref:Uncharacterized protein n=2 Tax=Methylorubrum extorquens TaxID=408 RepID=C5B2T3_METEA|nr:MULTISPECIES: hypothetical protein [Methylorubrum]ACS41963.1 hypothetical protein; putative exported protein [Methylorubrum extorquens AM1]APX85515.1 hypothetical protein BV511_12800 [Methylorubrum extorquens]EHP94385.1 hypothetical protein MetexDRAFT_0702 [Methylorubrum extorquens DSM 13060]MCP1544990.1 hypothetical protein [Methylorubrum extorquens]MCP1587663.1 hypothetical protein [Methylorubrum extorquens]
MRILGNHFGPPARRGLTAAGLLLATLLGTGLGPSPAAAQSEPPIRSAEDAFCRSEARAQVFSAPDPLNLGLREIGRRIWASCMDRTQRKAHPLKARPRKGQKPRKRRHR